jgi:hypothetical protein
LLSRLLYTDQIDGTISLDFLRESWIAFLWELMLDLVLTLFVGIHLDDFALIWNLYGRSSRRCRIFADCDWSIISSGISRNERKDCSILLKTSS